MLAGIFRHIASGKYNCLEKPASTGSWFGTDFFSWLQASMVGCASLHGLASHSFSVIDLVCFSDLVPILGGATRYSVA